MKNEIQEWVLCMVQTLYYEKDSQEGIISIMEIIFHNWNYGF